MKWSEKLGRYNKAIEAFFGLVIICGTTLLGLSDQIPEDVSKWVTVVVAVITVIRVWWVKNEPLVMDTIDQIEVLTEELRTALQPAHESLTNYVEPQLGVVNEEIQNNVEPALNTINERVAALSYQVGQLIEQLNTATQSSGRHSR